ncbi:hypothetical protein ACIOG8_36680 [Streptomyces erythrochromogenes]|uniref:hypothetical protein n=1 Tax=Streptomyces erythrochromogenes TaxID=285574 RepID=UPI00380BB22E
MGESRTGAPHRTRSVVRTVPEQHGRVPHQRAVVPVVLADAQARVTETAGRRRHQAAYFAQLLASGARPAAIVPGVPRQGEDVGRWLASQRRNCDRLNEKQQQRRFAALGMKKVPRARRAPTRRMVRAGGMTPTCSRSACA